MMKAASQTKLSPDEEGRLNQQTFERIWQETKAGSSQWVKGQWVGLLFGQVVAVSSDFDEVLRAVRQIEPNRRRGMMFRIGEDYDKPVKVL